MNNSIINEFKKEYNQIDIDALKECFKIFLGDYSIEKIKKMKSYKELKEDFNYSKVLINFYTLEDYIETQKKLYSFRKPLTGYLCDNNFRCSSIKPKFKNYKFWIWHEIANTQLFVYRNDKTYEIIRLECDDLYKTIYDFFTQSKVVYIQQSLFI